VLVTFTVQVPPRTPFGDTVYLATDISGWSATAIRMDRIDALHYRVTQTFKSGTHFLYRYTRGSWQSAERGQNGLEVPPREFLVRNADTQSVTNVVYHWGDEDPTAPDLGNAIPTPFQPIPFKTPSHH
jgi:pullulanase